MRIDEAVKKQCRIAGVMAVLERPHPTNAGQTIQVPMFANCATVQCAHWNEDGIADISGQRGGHCGLSAQPVWMGPK